MPELGKQNKKKKGLLYTKVPSLVRSIWFEMRSKLKLKLK
jgi:hypothetical protein